MGIISPSYSKSEVFEAKLSGTKFIFHAPPHNHPRIPANKDKQIEKNLYDDSNFEQFPSSDNHEIFSSALKYIDWTFWRRRFVLAVDSVAHVVFTSTVFKFEEFSSLFNRENFECAVERLIFAHGRSFSSSGLCRQNWRVKKINGVEWVAFENDGRYSSRGLYSPCQSVIQTFYLTPISDEHMLCVYFTQVTRKEAGGLDDAFARLRNAIMSSVGLTLSEDAQQQKQAVEKAYPNQEYSSQLPPYEYELKPYPNRDDMHDVIMRDRGVDQVNAMSETAYSEAIDALEKQALADYNSQVDAILASHLRFKNQEPASTSSSPAKAGSEAT